MAYLKLSVSRTMDAVPHDFIDIPNIATECFPSSTVSAAATGPSGTFVIADFTKNFIELGIKPGMIFQNNTTKQKGLIIEVNNNNFKLAAFSPYLPLGTAGDSYSLYAEGGYPCVIYVGTPGDLAYISAGGDESIMVAAPVGWHPVNLTRVLTTGTTAGNLLAGW